MQCNKKFLDILLSSFKNIVDWGLFVRSSSTCQLTAKGQPRSQALSPLQICFGAKIMTSQAVQRPCCPSPRLAVYGLSSSPKCYSALFQFPERDTSILLLSPIAHLSSTSPHSPRGILSACSLSWKWNGLSFQRGPNRSTASLKLTNIPFAVLGQVLSLEFLWKHSTRSRKSSLSSSLSGSFFLSSSSVFRLSRNFTGSCKIGRRKEWRAKLWQEKLLTLN